MHPLVKGIYYIKHRILSINWHGAHSPFLYDLFEKVFRKPFNSSDKFEFKLYKNKQLSNFQSLLFEEYGAGKNHQRIITISEIAKKSAISHREAKLIINLSRHLNPKTILELGTSTGISTHAFRIGAPGAEITTIEGCTALSKYISENYANAKTHYISSTFEDFFEQHKSKNTSWDLIYIDGNHTFEATLNYYQQIKERHIHKDSCVIFDDIYWSKGMLKAWQQIISDEAITLSIDLFYMGIVFFNPQLSKQHFNITI